MWVLKIHISSQNPMQKTPLLGLAVLEDLTPPTVPHSKMAVITFSRDGKIGTPGRNIEKSSLNSRAVNVSEIHYSIDVVIL
jgi:hypothetical protein